MSTRTPRRPPRRPRPPPPEAPSGPCTTSCIDHQDALTPLDLRRYASELGLDTDRFTDGLHRHRYADHIAEDVASADASGVAGTPSLFNSLTASATRAPTTLPP